MTREELILYGKDYLHDLETTCCKIEEKHKEFVRESIKALEQEPSDDCVSRQAMLKEIPRLWNSRGDKDYCMETLRDFVTELPPVTPTRKKGKWIVEDSGNYNGKYSTCYCSNCKDYYTRAWKEMNYCPNCGAEMVGAKNE